MVHLKSTTLSDPLQNCHEAQLRLTDATFDATSTS